MKLLPKSEYFRHILTLLGGSASAQLILLAIAPVLARLFAPTDFGVFALFVAISSVVGMIATGRYDIAIFLPRDHSEARLLFVLAVGLALLAGIVITGIAVALVVGTRLIEQSYLPLGLLLGLAVALQGWSQSSSVLANRLQLYPAMTRSRIAGSLGIAVFSCLFGWTHWAAMGLIFGKLAGQALEVVLLQFSLQRHFRANPVTCTRSNLLAAGRKYRNFLRFSTIEGLLNSLFRQVPVFALSGFFSAQAAGLFNMVQNLIAKPLGMVSTAFGQVLFQQAATRSHDNPTQLRSFLLKNLYLLTVLVLPASLLLLPFTPALFALVLGSPWRTAGIYAAWLMPFFALSFIKSPLSCIIDIKNKMRENLLFEISFLLISTLSFVWAQRHTDPLLGIQLFSIANSLISIGQIWWFLSLSGKTSSFK